MFSRPHECIRQASFWWVFAWTRVKDLIVPRLLASVDLQEDSDQRSDCPETQKGKAFPCISKASACFEEFRVFTFHRPFVASLMREQFIITARVSREVHSKSVRYRTVKVIGFYIVFSVNLVRCNVDTGRIRRRGSMETSGFVSCLAALRF